MAQKRKEESEFKVSDRRLFTADGELRFDTPKRSQLPLPPPWLLLQSLRHHYHAPPPAPASAVSIATPPGCNCLRPAKSGPESDIPEPPTASEQQAQHDAYKQSSRDLDTRVELSGHSAKELEMSFERFMASLYMTAMMQLGLMHEQGGQPGVDMIGARQTIDTLGMIAEKTKGNLTPKEQGFLQNCLYELRMAYVEVTNALARPPQAPGPITGTNG
jgi:hypothetical protein